MREVHRRSFLKKGIAAAVATSIPTRHLWAQEMRLRLSWWGNADRAARTQEVIAAFLAANPSVQIDGQSLPGGGDYWTWLATQSSGGNPPDVIQMDYRYISEYATRGVLLPLDDLIGGTIDLSSWPQDRIDVGKVDGKVYGVSLGSNTGAAILNLSAWEEAGVAAPTIGTTWEEFATLCADFANKTERRRFYASQDASGHDFSFEAFLRQRGKEMYAEGGTLGFTAEDALVWFTYWNDMRAAGACVPADVQALSEGNVDTSVITTGKAATGFAQSNQLVSYQNANKDRLGMTAFPVVGGGAPGQYLKPSQYFSVSARTANPELAGRFLNHFLNDPAAMRILGVERGAPESPDTRATIMPTLDAPSQAALEYLEAIADLIGPLPPAPPQGAGEATMIMKSVAEEVAFEVKSAEQGAEDLVSGMGGAIRAS
ncbi:ABC transporter substrate-binding protein [Falsirhodobacter xinxiangensis]|uniref:ABC transporter substrate-binding protein n=1 Tax=Falsirhodobacter xinxiangensis TaxID=2530049 RepID=UPI0010A99CA1|nr:extracellular solute-binding protein [Rhodobacter xinxiangensis]